MKSFKKLVIVATVALGLGIGFVQNTQLADPPPGAGIVDPAPDTTM